MWDKILPWIGGIFAAIGLVLIFFDVISSIKRRDKTKTNIIGLVLLSIAVVGYTVTDLILKDSVWPPLASLLWIGLFWIYVILDAITTLGHIKAHRRNKKVAASSVDNEQAQSEATKTEEASDSVTTADVVTDTNDTDSKTATKHKKSKK